MAKHRLILVAIILALGGLAGCGGHGFWTTATNSTTTTNTSQTVAPKFAFVANNNNGGKGTISGYTVDSTSGNVSGAGTPIAAGDGPVAIASNSTGTFVYAANQAGGVAAFSVDRTSGALTAITGSPFSTGTTPSWIGVSADDKFAYVTNAGSNDISAFSIDSKTGALTALTPAVSLAGTPSRAAIAPTGRFLYAGLGSDGIQVLGIGTDGRLTAVKKIAATPCAGVAAIAIDRKANFVFAADINGGVCNFAMNASNGDLTPITAALNPGGNAPLSIAMDPAAKYLFTANSVSNDVSGFLVAADGALTPMTGSPFSAGQGASDVAVDPSGKFVYVINAGADTMSVFSISSGNTLKSGGTATTGSNPRAIVITE